MKNIIKGLMVMLMGSAAYGGAFEGNGGDIVTCFDTAGEITSRKLLDYYELENQNGETLDLGEDGMSAIEKVHYVLDKLEATSLHRAEKYRADLEEFMDRTIFVDGEIPEMDDEGELNLPNNCILQQVAIQFSGKNQPRKKYLIHQIGWDTMDENSKAGLILHEIIFGEVANGSSSQDLGSVNVRALNRFISSESFVGASQKDMILFYKDHMYNDATYNEFEILLQWSHVRFYEDSNVLESISVKMVNQDEVQAGPIHLRCDDDDCRPVIMFRESGIVRGYKRNLFRSKITVLNKLMLGEVEIHPDYKEIHFHDDGETVYAIHMASNKYENYMLVPTENGDTKCVIPVRVLGDEMVLQGSHLYFNKEGEVITTGEGAYTYSDRHAGRCDEVVQPLGN